MPQITLNRAKVQKLHDLCVKHGRDTFFLAKDQGAYVGACGGSQDDGTFENCIFYFKGCDPQKDEDFYDNARQMFGGDDFGEHFSADILKAFLDEAHNTKMVIKVGQTSIRFDVYAKPKAKPKSNPPLQGVLDQLVAEGKVKKIGDRYYPVV